MQFIQTLVTDEQALQIRLAIDMVLQTPDRFVLSDEERTEYERLAVFWGHAASNPSAFSPTGEMAQRVKSIVRRAKGPAQPKSRRNKRKERQARRQSYQKMRRAQRREYNALFNNAMESLHADQVEMEQIAQERVKQYESEPKFEIRGPDGSIVMAGVPASAIIAMTEGGEDKPHIIMPGSAEALGFG